jgi:hypothetical protein
MIHLEVLYNILAEFDIPMKIVRLLKPCLNGTYSKNPCMQTFDTFPIRNGLKHGDNPSLLRFNFLLQYTIKKVQENQVWLKLNGTY